MQKVLFQVNPAPFWTPTPYVAGTVPVNKEWHIHTMTATNLTMQDEKDTYEGLQYKIHVVKNWESPDVKNCLAYYPKYKEWESVHTYNNIMLTAWDSIVVYCLSGRIAIQWFWEEVALLLDAKYELALDAIIAMWPNIASIASSQATIAACWCP